MRAYEFIIEGKPEGKIPHHQKGTMGAVHKSRDVGGYDRTNHAYRMGMAMAMADGKSKKAVDMDSASWIEKYNTVHPYTKEEHNMIHSAMNTIPTDHKTVSNDHKSRETDDTHRVSPVSAWNTKSTKKKKTK
jgi:hypothetical protein